MATQIGLGERLKDRLLFNTVSVKPYYLFGFMEAAGGFYGCCPEFFLDPLSLFITNRPPRCASKVSSRTLETALSGYSRGCGAAPAARVPRGQ